MKAFSVKINHEVKKRTMLTTARGKHDTRKMPFTCKALRWIRSQQKELRAEFHIPEK